MQEITKEKLLQIDDMVALRVMKWVETTPHVYVAFGKGRVYTTHGDWNNETPFIRPIDNLGDLRASFCRFATWNPSRDIRAAWQVAEEIHLFDDRFIIETEYGWGIYSVSPHHPMGSGGVEIVVDIETAPLAICLAALSLVGFDPETLLTLNAGDLAWSCGCGASTADDCICDDRLGWS